jgi:hypothetical protein
MYARSRTSGESQSFVAVLRTRWTRPWDVSGLKRKSFTTAVSVCSCTYKRSARVVNHVPQDERNESSQNRTPR